VRIVPGTSAAQAEPQTPGQLPYVDEDHVDGQPLPSAPATIPVQVEVELFHHEAAAAVHKEGPERRVAAGWPISLPQKIKEESEEDLIQKAVHSEEKKAEQARQPLTGGSPDTPAASG